MPTVLILTGLAGSGKSTAAKFYNKHNFPVIRMGEVTDNLLGKMNLPYSEENEKYVREKFRETNGPDIYAKKIIPSILKLLKNQEMVVIEGMRNKEELNLFKKELPKIKIIYLEVVKELRFQRLSMRKYRPLNLLQARSRNESELKYFKLHNLKKYADYVLKNESDIKNLSEKLHKILQKIIHD